MGQTLQLLTSCDVPDCVGLSTRGIDLLAYVPSIGAPNGWTWIGHKSICPRHQVTRNWFVDGVRFDV